MAHVIIMKHTCQFIGVNAIRAATQCAHHLLLYRHTTAHKYSIYQLKNRHKKNILHPHKCLFCTFLRFFSFSFSVSCVVVVHARSKSKRPRLHGENCIQFPERYGEVSSKISFTHILIQQQAELQRPYSASGDATRRDLPDLCCTLFQRSRMHFFAHISFCHCIATLVVIECVHVWWEAGRWVTK